MLTFRNFSKVSHSERQYLNLINHLLLFGEKEKGRNGNVITTTGTGMRFSLENNTLPVFTSKKMAWKTCIKELLWFISGNTNNKVLNDQNVHIWDGNGSREYLDSRGLTHLKENDLGPIYGHQWRHYNAPYSKEYGCLEKYDGQGVDQLQNIIDGLINLETRTSRRHIMSAWNPEQLDEMSLPPCHVLSQYKVNDKDELTCILYQRSADVGLGLPFNVLSYSFLTHLLAHQCGLKAKEFVHFIGDAHIYEEHVEVLKEQVENGNSIHLPLFPTLQIHNKYENINDYTMEDFELIDYEYLDEYKMEMRV